MHYSSTPVCISILEVGMILWWCNTMLKVELAKHIKVSSMPGFLRCLLGWWITLHCGDHTIWCLQHCVMTLSAKFLRVVPSRIWLQSFFLLFVSRDIVLEAKSTEDTRWTCSYCSFSMPHVHAHRVILSASCQYLRALFQSGMQERYVNILFAT